MRMLSKSQMNTYLQCPMKWKLQYIDGKKSKPSPAMFRGIKIHSNIEKFYDNIEVKDNKIIPKNELGELGQFMKFEERRIKSCINKKGEFDLKYFKPLYQELKLANEELRLRGFVDAVYINPKDDGVICIDYKTGKYYPNKFDDYRFELAIYSELLRLEKNINVKYIGILFIDQDKLFFEELKKETTQKMHDIIKNVREEMNNKNYKPKKNKYCYFCDFKYECPLFN